MNFIIFLLAICSALFSAYILLQLFGAIVAFILSRAVKCESENIFTSVFGRGVFSIIKFVIFLIGIVNLILILRSSEDFLIIFK